MGPSRRPGARRALALWVAAVAAAAGCTSGAGRRETAALLNAVDGYRNAAVAAKGARAQAVGAVACSEASVCEARKVCVDAMEPTTRALALKDEVAARLADIEGHRLPPDDPQAAVLPAKLDEAQHLLESGRAKMTDCERRLADLRVQYGG